MSLMILLLGGMITVGLSNGWFNDEKVELNAEYFCEGMSEGEFMDIEAEGYEKLIQEKKSFVVFVDQGGCTVADRLRGYVKDWGTEVGVKVYRISFSETKETSLHEYVKYYPSVAVVSKGEVKSFLRADSDEDANIYNNYEDFVGWMAERIMTDQTEKLK